MNIKLKSKELDELFEAMSLITDTEEYYNFFEDLCTVAELTSLSHRFKAAKMLKEGKTYLEVSELTGASTATISRINKCLSYGAEGYNTIIERMNNKDKNNEF